MGLGLGSGLGSGFGLWVRARVLEVGGRDVELIARLDEEQILRLDVSVNDVDVVQVVHRSDHLVRGRGRVSDVVQVVHGSDHLSTPATPRAEERAVGREWRWGRSGGAGAVRRERRGGGGQGPQHARGAAHLGEQQLGSTYYDSYTYYGCTCASSSLACASS